MATIVLPSEALFETDNGQLLSVDSAQATMVETLTSTLVMLARKHTWVGAGGRIHLPALGSADDQDTRVVGTVEVLAIGWRRWERCEQRARHWGGRLTRFVVPGLPDWAPPATKSAWLHEPGEGELDDWSANERWKDVVAQNFARLHFETNAQSKVAPMTGSFVPLAPAAWVSLAELNGAGLFSDLLSVDPFTEADYQGLWLAEWLRGYAVLQIAASEARTEASTPIGKHLVRFAPGELEARLELLGLRPDAAAAFVDHATLGTKSKDMFDCPLLRLSDGSLLLFGPAAADVEPARVALSNLVRLKEKFEPKGTAFQDRVRDFFQKLGYASYTIDTKRGGVPYEIDVLVPWNDHLFLFECKNHNLSEHHPIQSANFERERRLSVQKVERQLTGLLAHPDMSTDAGGVDPTRYKTVPVLLYSLPYARRSNPGDILIADWSALKRFFKERYLTVKRPLGLGCDRRSVYRTLAKSLWSSERPSPEDLVAYLTDPPGAELVRSQAEWREVPFLLGDGHVGVTWELSRGEMTMEKVAAILGFDARRVRREMDIVEKSTARAQRSFEERELIKRTRRWRETEKRRRTD